MLFFSCSPVTLVGGGKYLPEVSHAQLSPIVELLVIYPVHIHQVADASSPLREARRTTYGARRTYCTNTLVPPSSTMQTPLAWRCSAGDRCGTPQEQMANTASVGDVTASRRHRVKRCS